MPSMQAREESWKSLHHSDASGDDVDDGYSDVSMDDESESHSEHSAPESPTFPTISDVQRALHPLQATADRVGKQVELFAVQLDRHNAKKQQESKQGCSHVLPLVHAYQEIANNTIKHLGTMHSTERRQQLSKRTRRTFRPSSGQSTPGLKSSDRSKEHDMMTSVEDLKYWEQEERTWDLLGLMLQVEHPIPEADKLQDDKNGLLVRPKKETGMHHYSPEKDVWDSFLASDDQAWERHTVVEWLKQSAEKTGQDVAQVVEELESGADRGSGLWAHSWLYSKEAIKGQKRLRSWPKTLEPDNPGLEATLLNSDKTQALVTQLDPDAITRQTRTLEKQDQFYERATWLACWEMTRRGQDWDHMHVWCQDRAEVWRATAMLGDPRSTPSNASSIASLQSRTLWRKTCALAAKDGGIDEYENAVYGVLSGYLPSVLKVSRNWDDYLFAHYNSYLLYSFERYVGSNFADRLPSAMTNQHSTLNFSIFGGQRVLSGNQLVEKMKQLDVTKEEAREPIKMLQGSLIAKKFDDFVYRHGARLARSANSEGRSKILLPMSEKILEGNITADFSMVDHDLLRLITHIIIIFQDLGFNFGEGDRRYAMETIIVAYVDYLSKAGKQQLLPLYASRLSPQRSVACLGRQLPHILDHTERKTFMSLMTQEGIEVPAVLNTQLIMIISDAPPSEGNVKSFSDMRILGDANERVSALRHIRPGFVSDGMTDDQQDLIHGFEWYLLLDGHWRETMMVGTVVYKHLLRVHGLAAARLMSQTVTFSAISLSKTKAILGKSIDISKSQDSTHEERPTSRSSRSRYGQKPPRRHNSSEKEKRFKDECDLMLNQARTFRDFENLFAAFDALEEWEAMSQEAQKYSNPRQDSRLWKGNFQKAFERVERTVQLLLHNWLQDPNSDTEAAEFKQIRQACLPETVLAYNAVLDFSSRFLSRNLLLKGMNLAAIIAADGSDLAPCFMAAERMPELVDSFASLSKTMIRADDKAKSKKQKGGETLALWSVRAPSP